MRCGVREKDDSGPACPARLVVVVGTAAPGELRKYYREQVQDIVYGAMVK
jgi:hypothetical protein